VLFNYFLIYIKGAQAWEIFARVFYTNW